MHIVIFKMARSILFSLFILSTFYLFGFAELIILFKFLKTDKLNILIAIYVVGLATFYIGVYAGFTYVNKKMIIADKYYRAKVIDLSHYYDENKPNSRDNYEGMF
ncbi:UNVERIFIED_CONTAM: hypothetical protein O8I53_10350 [Campylobacter lari]